jgi:S-adenosyl methyltransferase
MLHAVSDDDHPHQVMSTIMDALPEGSYLAISHPASDIEQERATAITASVNPLSYQQYTARSRDQVLRFFDGMELVEPGLVQVQQWRPAAESVGTLSLWAAIGRK